MKGIQPLPVESSHRALSHNEAGPTGCSIGKELLREDALDFRTVCHTPGRHNGKGATTNFKFRRIFNSLSPHQALSSRKAGDAHAAVTSCSLHAPGLCLAFPHVLGVHSSNLLLRRAARRGLSRLGSCAQQPRVLAAHRMVPEQPAGSGPRPRLSPYTESVTAPALHCLL